jgi:arabinan endo-1,5-alpha-L-arabinosidase
VTTIPPAPTSGDGPARGVGLADIQVRDPFLVNDAATSTYWLYGSTDENIWSDPGTGFDAYRRADLVDWQGPFPAFRPPAGFWSRGQFWAPEVHRYAGRWFMFATFTGPDGHRGTQVLASDALEGPFVPWSDGPVTPARWRCLDGTLHVDDDGLPWIVYCHEWIQAHDGGVVAQRLSEDLRRAVGNPIYLFTASEAPWSKPMTGERFAAYPLPVHVTDGCFLFRLASGHLIMLWSSFGERGYAMGIAHSESGHVLGPWTQEEHPIWAADGGHGMIVRLRDGRLALTLHQPNRTPDERAVIRLLDEGETTVTLQDADPGLEVT